MNNTINLDDYRSRDKVNNIVSKVFTGRDRGVVVREKSRIDELEKECERINIIIPEDIYSINPSFFEELFFNVVKKIGKEEFFKRFSIEYKGYDFSDKLYEAIERILRDRNALEK